MSCVNENDTPRLADLGIVFTTLVSSVGWDGSIGLQAAKATAKANAIIVLAVAIRVPNLRT